MADIRINSLPTTASASSSDDFLALDGATNGTRKLNAFSPTFGGNATVGGTLTMTGAIKSDANGTYPGALTGTGVRLYSNAVTGATLYGRGSDTDVLIVNRSGQSAIGVPAGGFNTTVYGNLTVSGTGNNIFNSGGGNLLIGGVIDGGQKLQVNGTASFTDTITAVKSLNGDFSNFITNVNTGTASEATLYVSNAGTGATSATLGVTGTGYTTTGGFVQDAGVVSSGTGLSGGLSIMARAASSDIRFYAGAHTNLVATFASTGNATFTGDLTVSGGNVGVGGAPSAGIGVRVSGTNFAGLYQYGLLHDGELSGTTESNGLTAAGSIKASTAVTDFNAISVVKPGMGSGASIVTSRGLQITNLGVGGGITHVYGIDIQAQSGAATTNVAIRAAGKIMFTSLPTSSVGLATGELWNDSGTVKIAL